MVVVQRRGSLFPEDDLRLLGQFARHAATALDHARLIADARERERRAAERRLREVESRMSLMLDSIKDYAMFVLDDRGRVATWEAGAEHVFGYTSDEMTDEPAATLFDMSPAEFDALIAEAQRLGHADREGACRRRDGSKFVGATTIRPMQGEVGDPPGLVVVTHDVTEQRNLEARLQQSQKMEAIGQLAGGIAHDFNNLLTGILGYAHWLERGLAGDPRAKAGSRRDPARGGARRGVDPAAPGVQPPSDEPPGAGQPLAARERPRADVAPRDRRADHGRPRHAARDWRRCSATTTSSSRSCSIWR